MEYKVSLGITAKIVTTFTTLLLAGVSYLILSASIFGHGIWSLLAGLVAVFITLSIYLSAYFFKPLKYVVSENTIIIKRLFRNFVIEISEIKRIFSVEREFMKNTERTFGSGGLFGFYGEFKNPVFGDMTWYATRSNHFVMIETMNDKKIVLTPDDAGFVNDVKAMLHLEQALKT